MPAKQLILTGLGIILGVLTLACGNTAPPKAVGIVGEPRIAPTSTALPEPSPVVVATNIPGTPTPVVATSIPVPTAARVAGPPRPVQPTVAAQVTPPVVTHARAAVVASAVVVSPDGLWVVVVNPDSDSVTVVDAVTLLPLAEISVGHHPRTLTITPDSRQAVVANHGSGTLSLIDLARLEESTQWPVGAMPYGVVTDGSHVFFTEFGSGRVGVIDLATNSVLDRIPVDPFPAGLALSADGRSLLVTHLFTGQVTLVDTTDLTASLTVTAGSGTNMSQFITISPDGSRAYLPQTRSNSTNAALLFDTTVFPVVNVLNIGEMEFLPRERISLDVIDDPVNMPFSAALAPNGQTLYVSNAGSDDISVIDLDTGQSLAQIPAGANPRGIAITPDGDRVFVANVLDGTMSVMNTESLAVTSTVDVTDIPLATDVLLGKKIFNSAAEPRLTTDNWISCAVCHFDGGMDARTWVGFPDGPRNTPALFGVGETLPIHWSGDLDELQDVELTIRNIQFGEGLIPGDADDSLGPPHAGRSAELDALAAYLDALQSPPSPLVSDSETIRRGEATFNALGCQVCHIPPLYTDTRLHDVGTGETSKEKNSHGRGTSFDTPSLAGLWLTAPYFHDGSAPTLEQALQTGTVHNIRQEVSAQGFEALIAYLLALPTEE